MRKKLHQVKVSMRAWAYFVRAIWTLEDEHLEKAEEALKELVREGKK